MERAIVRDPQVFLFDELLSNLDFLVGQRGSFIPRDNNQLESPQ